MQPKSVPPAPPPAPIPSGGQYDFIMNSGQKPKGGFSNSSTTQRIMVVALAAVGFILILVFLFSVVFKTKGGAVVQLTDLAQQQSEIARVADIGLQKATSTATKNFAHTAKLTMISDQQQTLALLKKSGHKLSEKQLLLKTNAATDEQLNSAAANSTFDTTFKRIIADELSSYRSSLQADYRTATSAGAKQLLQDIFNNVSVLLGENQTL